MKKKKTGSIIKKCIKPGAPITEKPPGGSPQKNEPDITEAECISFSLPAPKNNQVKLKRTRAVPWEIKQKNQLRAVLIQFGGPNKLSVHAGENFNPRRDRSKLNK